jgi:peptide/nickel transport system substrate-binding protein
MGQLFMGCLALLLALNASAGAAETPKRGGTLTYMIPADAPPSFDGHRENTFATIHAVAPFYSVLIRVNPDDPASTTDFVCDVCTEIPEPADGGRTYAFRIRDDVKFQDGSMLTAYDVAASWNKIVAPPDGVISARRGYYSMVDKIEAPDPKTVIFRLKFATAAFLPALADPYAFIYKKELLDRDPRWFEKQIMGSGPFRFKEYQVGQSISGVRNPDYYRQGLPYLDAFTGIFADKQAVRVSAIRSDRAAIEFRGFPPATRDELAAALGEQITVQESDWNCGNLITPNHKRKPFDDVRVRRALTLAIDRWHGAPALSRISVMKTVGGVGFPGSPLGATKAELEQLAGYWPDIEKSRAEARRLLKEAGAENLTFELLNRNVDQPYKFNGTWVIDEWSKIGVKVNQRVLPTGPFGVPQWRFRCGARRRLPEYRQSAARRDQVPAPLGLELELRQLRGSGGSRALRSDAAGDQFCAAARANAPIRKAGARYQGARNFSVMAVSHRSLSKLCQRLENQSQPLRQPRFGDDLARQVIALYARLVATPRETRSSFRQGHALYHRDLISAEKVGKP